MEVMTKPKVVKVSSNIKDAVKIDRGTRWGNPFVMGIDGDRDDVCNLYEQYAKWRLELQPNWLDDLKGKDLACHCAPKRCHGDTLIRLANQ